MKELEDGIEDGIEDLFNEHGDVIMIVLLVFILAIVGVIAKRK